MSDEKNPFNLQLTWADPRNGEAIEQVFALPISLGRDSSNDIMIPSTSVSRQHAVIEFNQDKVILKDLNSSNGSYINGEQVSEGVVSDGDEVTLGEIRIQVVFTQSEARTKRPDREHLFGALLAGESEKTISLQSIKKTKGLFADITPDSTASIESPRPSTPPVSEEKLSGDDLKSFLSGRLQKDIQTDISPDVERMAATFKPPSKEAPASAPTPQTPPTAKPSLQDEATLPNKPIEASSTAAGGLMSKIFDRLRGLFGG